MKQKSFKNIGALFTTKIVLLIFVCLLLVCFYLLLANANFKRKYLYKSPYSPSPPITPTTQILPSPTISESSLLKRIKLLYDVNRFVLVNGSVYKVNINEQVPALILSDRSNNLEYLKIVDMSSFNQEITNLNEVVSLIAGGADKESTLRNVMISGKSYSFQRAIYGEGFPTSENCYQGGEVDGDYIYVKEKKIGILVKSTKHEEGCKNTDPTITVIPNKQVLEEILQVIESLRIE
jgi:hypothetical protein